MRNFTRAFAGAYIFGIPLLFTMEMWWIGEYATRWKLLAFLLVAFLANFGLTYVAGFKRESSLFATVGQTVDVVAVGIVSATVMLLVLNRIGPDISVDSAIGMVLVQAVPLSIGASVANEIFGSRRDNGRNGGSPLPELHPWQELAADVGATAIGGVFVGFSIAPTDEVPMLAAALDYPHLLALIGFTLVLSYGIVFASGFDRSTAQGPLQTPINETVLAYIVSLAVSFLSLYLLDQIDVGQPLLSTIEQVLVLGVPTTVGGAAGRLVI